jgi:signal transduction histidine kinase
MSTMDAPQTPAAPSRRPLSLKLTVSFIAFLAVLPVLAWVAWLQSSEEEERARDREWHVARINVAVSFMSWFDRHAQEAKLLAMPPLRPPGSIDVPEDELRAALRDAFPAAAKHLGLQDAALFWNRGEASDPKLELLAAQGSVDKAPDSQLVAAAQNRIALSGPLERGGGVGHPQVQTSLPLHGGGQTRAIVRLVLLNSDWTSRGVHIAGSLATWVNDLRIDLLRTRIAEAMSGASRADREAVLAALAQPVADVEQLKSALEAEAEAFRDACRLSGFAVFLAVPSEDGRGRVLRPWIRCATAPQEWSNLDRSAFESGVLPPPERDGDVAHIALPLFGNAQIPDSADGRIRVQKGVVAVAHFQVPPPPTGTAASRVFLIFMIAAMAVILGFLFFYMNQAITLPIQRLIAAMSHGARGDLQPIAQGGGSGEVAQLALIYNSMVRENRKLMDQIRGFNEDLQTKVRNATGELERRNAELRKANERLFGLQRELTEQQRMASLGQLAGRMAHELGSPLNAMTGHIELLLAEETQLPPDMSKRLRMIGGQVERLSGIIQNTLQQLRAPAPRFASVDLNALVQGIVSLVTPSVSARRIAIRTSLAPALPRVSGDPAQLEQVLMNLVNNSLDAMPDGGSLDLLTAASDGSVCLQVRDSGRGVPPEDLPRIFDPFFTTKGPGKGTGLGLAICREIVKAHSGTIDVQSEPGKGCWFTVRIPPEERLEGAAAVRVFPAEARK